MSGGHYDYKYYHIQQLAEEIQKDFEKGGVHIDEYDSKPYDRLEGLSDKQRAKVLDEIRKFVKTLKSCAKKARDLEWFMSGDTAIDSLLNTFDGLDEFDL